jgi:hypothetical protein
MKKAYICIENNGQTFNNLPIGTIAIQCFMAEKPFQDSVDLGLFQIVEFDEELINPSYLKTVLVNGVWTVEEDTQEKIEDENIQKEMLKMQYGKEVLAYVGVLFNSLTVENYQTLLMDQEIAMIQNLLRQGALQSSKDLLSSYLVNSIVTQEIKDKISLKLDHYIAQV